MQLPVQTRHSTSQQDLILINFIYHKNYKFQDKLTHYHRKLPLIQQAGLLESEPINVVSYALVNFTLNIQRVQERSCSRQFLTNVTNAHQILLRQIERSGQPSNFVEVESTPPPCDSSREIIFDEESSTADRPQSR